MTGLSGSGPAYVFLVAEALIEAGVMAGLPGRSPASWWSGPCWARPACWTRPGEDPEALRAAVTSPGGTTAAGLRTLGVQGGALGLHRGRGLGHRALPPAGPLTAFAAGARGVRSQVAEGVIVTMAQQRDEGERRFMTVDEVAAVLRVSTMTVYRLINGGELPAVRIGRSYRVREDEFDRYLLAHRTRAG